jgi:hypothetical protein
MFDVKQERAIGLLSLGMSAAQVAHSTGIDRATLWRWKQEPEFAKALDRHTRELQGGLHHQIQSIARESIESVLDGVRELRHLALHDHTPATVRRAAAWNCVRAGDRWLDIMGYHPNRATPEDIAVNQPENPSAAPLPDASRRGTAEENRPMPVPATELQPPNPLLRPEVPPEVLFNERNELYHGTEPEDGAQPDEGSELVNTSEPENTTESDDVADLTDAPESTHAAERIDHSSQPNALAGPESTSEPESKSDSKAEPPTD